MPNVPNGLGVGGLRGFGVGGREGEKEGGAFVDLGFGPNFAAVLADDARDGGEADASTLEFFGAMEALKDAEQFVRIPHVKTCPVIADKIDVLVLFKFTADFYDGGLALTAVFEGVGKEVTKQLGHLERNGVDRGEGLVADLGLALLDEKVEFGEDFT